jgi:hypothetical protein
MQVDERVGVQEEHEVVGHFAGERVDDSACLQANLPVDCRISD